MYKLQILIEIAEDIEDVLLFIDKERKYEKVVEEQKQVNQVFHSDIKSLKWNPEVSSKVALFKNEF